MPDCPCKFSQVKVSKIIHSINNNIASTITSLCSNSLWAKTIETRNKRFWLSTRNFITHWREERGLRKDDVKLMLRCEQLHAPPKTLFFDRLRSNENVVLKCSRHFERSSKYIDDANGTQTRILPIETSQDSCSFQINTGEVVVSFLYLSLCAVTKEFAAIVCWEPRCFVHASPCYSSVLVSSFN